MAIPHLTDEQLRAAVDAVDAAGGNIAAAAATLGMNRTTLSARYNKAINRGYIPKHGLRAVYPESRRLGKVTLQRNLKTGEVERSWERMHPAEDERLLEALVQGLVAQIPDKALVKARPARAAAAYHPELMTVIPWGDPHFGMYAWAEESGNNFDLGIAEKDLCAAVRYLVALSPPCERCLLINLGDFFHSDNMAGMTSTHKNILDMDSRLSKVVQVGIVALRAAIEEALKRHRTVEIINAIGNHDEVLSRVMSPMLAHIYSEEPRVTVRTEPTIRHYHRFGDVLIGVTHGHRCKADALPLTMATERAVDWGQTKFRYWYHGHHHRRTVKEHNGAVVEGFRTLTPGDAYAVENAHLSRRDMHGIVMHSRFGEVSRHLCPIEILRSKS